MNQQVAIPVNIDPPTKHIPLGTEFTIKGVRLLPNGRFLTDCKPGEETRLVNSRQPSIFVLRDRHV